MKISASVLAFLLLLTKANSGPNPSSDSTEDRPFGYHGVPSLPSTVNFNEIFSNSLSILTDEPGVTTTKEPEKETFKEADKEVYKEAYKEAEKEADKEVDKELYKETDKEKDEFHLSSLPSQFVEFHPHTSTMATTTTPKPRYLTASYLRLDTSTLRDDSSSTSTTPKAQKVKSEGDVKVLPLQNTGRGVLDLIFPAARVRTFKSVFDTVKRMLSHTFRK